MPEREPGAIAAAASSRRMLSSFLSRSSIEETPIESSIVWCCTSSNLIASAAFFSSWTVALRVVKASVALQMLASSSDSLFSSRASKPISFPTSHCSAVISLFLSLGPTPQTTICVTPSSLGCLPCYVRRLLLLVFQLLGT